MPSVSSTFNPEEGSSSSRELWLGEHSARASLHHFAHAIRQARHERVAVVLQGRGKSITCFHFLAARGDFSSARGWA
jgi:hypothetical protein